MGCAASINIKSNKSSIDSDSTTIMSKNPAKEMDKHTHSTSFDHKFYDVVEDANQIEGSLVIVVLGASGDLAKKKTFPALFSLHCVGLLPEHTVVLGYARSHMTQEAFRKQISTNFKAEEGSSDAAKMEYFLNRCWYHSGQYDSDKDFQALDAEIRKYEQQTNRGSRANRVFYYALPPTVYVQVSRSIRNNAWSSTGFNRVIIEKPFGRDLESSEHLVEEMKNLFHEKQIYRIDHYLGKEMVQNLLVLRFANLAFSTLWNRNTIDNVQITFKEDIGIEGRGGYFDQYGIIRDVMQNHLLQILSIVAMECPVSLDAEDVRDEKVKVLRCIQPVVLEDVVIGQYTASEDGKHGGYLDDETVPKDSVTPTFAAAVLHINNERWDGVPFILKCGKGLSERRTEIRIQLHSIPGGHMFNNPARNEIVIRVQPNEAIYMKLTSKVPGMSDEMTQTELDLTYKQRYTETRVPDAYERLIYDVLRGDHRDFVRADELKAAWEIFTPLLHRLENERIQPEKYAFGSRGPQSAYDLAQRYGYVRREDYVWSNNSTTATNYQ